ncbi:MAG: DUF445 family protein [Spirochaetota bacterium]
MEVSLLDIWFRRMLLFVTFIFGILQFVLTDKSIWINAGFVVSMAGIVGYYTNFLAIKMLFQPKQGKVLGWEGLVPKNKKKIAASLGESIQTQLLAPEIILEYIYERNLIEKGTEKLAEWSDQFFQDESVRTKITDKIISILKEKGPDVLNSVFNFSEENIKEITKNPQEIKKYWETLRENIIEYLRQQENREKVALWIRRVMLEELPALAHLLNQTLDDYLEAKKTFGGIGISIKKMISFNDDAIEDILEKFIRDPDTSEQFMGTLDLAVNRIEEKLKSESTQEYVLGKVEKWVTSIAGYTRQNILPLTIDKLKKYLDDPKNWEKLDKAIFSILNWGKDKTIEFMNSTEGAEYLKTNIGKAIHQLNVTQLVEEQVMKLDTDELEKMILDNTGGNLVVIQILGGGLGIIAGFIQVHIAFAFPVGILIAVAYISHYRNRKKYEKMH